MGIDGSIKEKTETKKRVGVELATFGAKVPLLNHLSQQLYLSEPR